MCVCVCVCVGTCAVSPSLNYLHVVRSQNLTRFTCIGRVPVDEICEQFQASDDQQLQLPVLKIVYLIPENYYNYRFCTQFYVMF